MIGAMFLFGVIVGIAFLALCNAWDRQPRRESMSERHYRLDHEAAIRTRPTSSNRKAGRGSL